MSLAVYTTDPQIKKVGNALMSPMESHEPMCNGVWLSSSRLYACLLPSCHIKIVIYSRYNRGQREEKTYTFFASLQSNKVQKC